MITEKKMLYFVEVCKTENISSAAKNLFIAQPALSKAIQDLETELGYPLFTRNGKRITLNENGKIFYHYAKHIVDTCDSARLALDQKKDEKNKHITLGVSVCSQLLSDILDGFYHKHPDVSISVKTGYPLDCMSDHLDLLLDADPYITLDKNPDIKEGLLLLSEEMCLAFSDTHPFYGKKEITRPDLYQNPCVLPSADSRMGALLSDIWDRYVIRSLSAACEVNNSYVQCELAAQGRYYTVVPEITWRPAYSANNLKLGRPPVVSLYRHIVLHRQPYLSPLAEEFVAYLQEYFSLLSRMA